MSVPWLSPSPKAFLGFMSGVLFWPCKLWCVSHSCWRWQAVWLYILISPWQVTNGCWPATGAHWHYYSHLSPCFSQHPSRLRQPLRVAMVSGIGEQRMDLIWSISRTLGASSNKQSGDCSAHNESTACHVPPAACYAESLHFCSVKITEIP